MPTHTIFFALFLVVAIAVLLFALVRVLRDLLERNAENVALIRDDGLSWPRRYQGSPHRPAVRE